MFNYILNLSSQHLLFDFEYVFPPHFEPHKSILNFVEA